jgi:hypothetical protein
LELHNSTRDLKQSKKEKEKKISGLWKPVEAPTGAYLHQPMHRDLES